MRIQHNILAMNAYRNYSNNTSALSKNLEKLSSGYKINRAGDDAAGLAISEKMRAQITGLDAAQKNVKDGISLVKTAEGALSEVHDMLNRMVYLATQSANGTYDGTDREQLQKELNQLRTEINRISEASNFNGIKLLDGSLDASGGVKTVDSLSRMLQQVGTGVENVGRVTILDSDPAIKSGKTIFEMDFTGIDGAGAPGGKDPDDPAKAELGETKYSSTEVSQIVNFSISSNADTAVINVGKYKFTINDAGEVAAAAGTIAWATDGANAWKMTATSDMSLKDILESIVAKIKTVGGGSSAIASIGGVNFKIEVSGNNGLKFTATKASVAMGVFGSTASVGEAALQKAFTDNVKASGTAKKTDDENDITWVADSWSVTASVGSASTAGYAVGTINVTKLEEGGVISVGGVEIKITASMVAPDGGSTAIAAATKKLVDAINAKAASANGFTVVATVDGSGASAKVKVTITETTKGSIKDTDGFKDQFKYGTVSDTKKSNVLGQTPAVTAETGSNSITFDVKLGGKTLVEGVTVSASEIGDAAKVAEAVLKALKSSGKVDANDNFTFEVNGAKYKVTQDGAKLKFELQDDPTDDNIKGNFDWNLTNISGGKITGNHTGGTNVVQEGRAVVTTDRANTIFRLDLSDIKDGTKITINAHDDKGNKIAKSVTIAIGRSGSAADVVYLTNEEAKNLDSALAAISKAFGGKVGDLVIGFNDTSNGDGHKGLTVKHAEGSGLTSKNAYLTMEDFAKVFSLEVPRNPEGSSLTLQIGDTADAFNQLSVNIAACDSSALGLDGVDISTQTGAANAINSLKAAINYVSDVRGTLGATQNRLEHTQNNLSVMAENIQDAESTIRDTDVAEEMMSYVKNNILIQSAQAMLAQANQVPQGVLQLLG